MASTSYIFFSQPTYQLIEMKATITFGFLKLFNINDNKVPRKQIFLNFRSKNREVGVAPWQLIGKFYMLNKCNTNNANSKFL